MQAIVYHNYGSPNVLELTEVQKPVPQEDEVLVKVVAASTAAGDWHRMRGAPYLLRLSEGLLKPKNPRLGADVAGRVEAVGKSATQFRPGDAVFGDLSTSGFGAFAEYVAAPENAFVSSSSWLCIRLRGYVFLVWRHYGVKGLVDLPLYRVHRWEEKSPPCFSFSVVNIDDVLPPCRRARPMSTWILATGRLNSICTNAVSV